ncbi:hypothetical protein [Butyricicoccus pullicaecorum]|mgnify:CR=1 FL=1|uniref:hypothetical protein n=1 Tax=Butyricicoccus pullicaecorum TaxID=501571 RepID=UPI00352262AE
MDILRILPFEGLNTIKLGMTPDEIATILGPPVHSRGEDCLDYDDINYTLSDRYRGMLHDVDLFGEKAEDVIRKLEALTPCTYEGDADKDLANEYIFPAWKIRFWRERAYHPKLMQDPEFIELISMHEENLAYELQFWHFESVVVYDDTIGL